MPKSLKKRSLQISNTRDTPAPHPPTLSSPIPIHIKLPTFLSSRATLLLSLVTLSIRICQSLPFSLSEAPYAVPIADCDETFNYWEATHLLLYHTGLQTWEYSPVYALRSYLYIWLHAAVGLLFRDFIWRGLIVGFLANFFVADTQNVIRSLATEKIATFYAIRASLAVLTSLAEIVFLYGIASRFGQRIAYFTAVFLLFSAGMGLGGAFAYLPGGFSMVFIMLAFGVWFYDVRRVSPKAKEEKATGSTISLAPSSYASRTALKWILCICFAGTSVILGWPFAVVCIIPLALDTIYHAGFIPSLKVAITISAFLITLSMAMDYIYYDRWFFTQWNLVNYNKGEGSERYGTEPWHFYFKNLLLNFNGAFVLSLIAPIVIVLRGVLASAITYYSPVRLLFYLIPYYVWFVFFSSLPHKEERFMVVVYPMICLAAAMCLEYSMQLLDYFSQRQAPVSGNARGGDTKSAATPEPRPTKNIILVSPPKRTRLSWVLIGLVLLAYIALSISRIYAITYNYSAPFKVYTDIAQHIERTRRAPDQVINVCVGKEWYRFTSSFFLPGQNTRLRFLRSDFRGLLPKYFADWPYSTSAIPTNMNDENREEMDRYIDESQCHYVIDLDLPHQHEKHYLNDSAHWRVISEAPFLDAERSDVRGRVLWVPFGWSEARNVYGKYYAAERI